MRWNLSIQNPPAKIICRTQRKAGSTKLISQPPSPPLPKKHEADSYKDRLLKIWLTQFLSVKIQRNPELIALRAYRVKRTPTSKDAQVIDRECDANGKLPFY